MTCAARSAARWRCGRRASSSWAANRLDQDTVAVAAGSIVSDSRDPDTLPARGNRPPRLPPRDPGDRRSGDLRDDRRGGRRGDRRARRGRVVPIALSGPWTPETLSGIFEAGAGLPAAGDADREPRDPSPVGRAAERRRSCSSSSTTAARQGPPPDWDVGHFTCVPARDRRAGREPLRRRRHLPGARQPRDPSAADGSAWRRRSTDATSRRAGSSRSPAPVRPRVCASAPRRWDCARRCWDNGTVTA